MVLGAIVCLELREPNRDRLVEIVAYGESDPSRGRFAYYTPVACEELWLESCDECGGPEGHKVARLEMVELLRACPAEAEADAWSQ